MSLKTVLLDTIDALEADLDNDDMWQALPEDRKDVFRNFSFTATRGDFSLDNGFDKTKLWNLLDSNKKARIATSSVDLDWIEDILERPATKIEMACWVIKSSFAAHVTEQTFAGEDPRALELLCFFGKFNAIQVSKLPRLSEGVFLSDPSDCSATIVGESLYANQIHHNMFTDESQLSFQKFKRFQIGGGRRDTNLENLIESLGLEEELKPKLMEFLPNSLETLKCARSFLSLCQSPLEPLTQTVFKTFLDDLMDKMNNFFPPADVTIVAGMDTVDAPVTISKNYMIRQARKRKVTPSGKAHETTIRIKSDMAIMRKRSVPYSGANTGEHLKTIFLECNVNIEMKKWGLLAKSQNKSPLTQVAAESMVRSLVLNERGKCPEKLFSLLTDCMVLYGVCHDDKTKEYWISRSVHSPEEILVTICWLYLYSIGEVNTNLPDWQSIEDDQVGDDEAMEEKESSSRMDVVNETDETENDGNDADGSMETGTANQEREVMCASKLFEEDSDEELREHWQTMFVMENHRKYGTPLPLTEALLSLHNARHEEA